MGVHVDTYECNGVKMTHKQIADLRQNAKDLRLNIKNREQAISNFSLARNRVCAGVMLITDYKAKVCDYIFSFIVYLNDKAALSFDQIADELDFVADQGFYPVGDF